MVENQQLAWSSKDKAGHVTTSGQIMLEPLTENQTRVTVTVNYVPPAGLIGDVATEIIAGPEQRLAKGLRRFKEYAEKSAKPVG